MAMTTSSFNQRESVASCAGLSANHRLTDATRGGFHQSSDDVYALAARP